MQHCGIMRCELSKFKTFHSKRIGILFIQFRISPTQVVQAKSNLRDSGILVTFVTIIKRQKG
jgi:hypothetical protein